MKTKIKVFKNGASAMLEKCGMWYVTNVRAPNGEMIDKMRCDDYQSACEYYRAFQAIARNS